MKDKNHKKTKIGVGSVVTEEVGEMKNNTREGRSRRTRKEVAGCVHDFGRKQIFLIKL